MKTFINNALKALFPTYDPARTNLAGAVIVGAIILFYAFEAH